MPRAGVQRAHVGADTAYMFSPMQTAELRAVHITFYDPRGAETSTLTAREGTYHWRPGDMEARGNVLVVRTDGATLRTEVLRYSQVRNQVSSDKPFVFDEPNRHIAGEGRSEERREGKSVDLGGRRIIKKKKKRSEKDRK